MRFALAIRSFRADRNACSGDIWLPAARLLREHLPDPPRDHSGSFPGGRLNRRGIIDRPWVDAILYQSEPSRADMLRVLELVGDEAWCRAWSS